MATEKPMVYLVLSDQYAKIDGGLTATYSATSVEAAFSDEARARAFIKVQPRRNRFGPLYWRTQGVELDTATNGTL